jgi:hypothetical protein
VVQGVYPNLKTDKASVKPVILKSAEKEAGMTQHIEDGTHSLSNCQ